MRFLYYVFGYAITPFRVYLLDREDAEGRLCGFVRSCLRGFGWAIICVEGLAGGWEIWWWSGESMARVRSRGDGSVGKGITWCVCGMVRKLG